MSRLQSYLVVVLVGPGLLAAGVVHSRVTPSALSEPSAPAASRAAVAQPGEVGQRLKLGPPLETLERAEALLAPTRVPWMELQLSQRVKSADFEYQAQGRFLTAPGRRLRLQMHVAVDGRHAEVRVVGDGCRLVQSVQAEGGEQAITETKLPASEACQELLEQRGVAGPAPLLRNIRRNLRQPQSELVRWQGQEYIRIRGGWPLRPCVLASLPGELQDGCVPRECHVYLDARTLWPRRIDWWGPDQVGGPDVLLMQTEFRDAVLNQPLPPERCAREFTWGQG